MEKNNETKIDGVKQALEELLAPGKEKQSKEQQAKAEARERKEKEDLLRSELGIPGAGIFILLGSFMLLLFFGTVCGCLVFFTEHNVLMGIYAFLSLAGLICSLFLLREAIKERRHFNQKILPSLNTSDIKRFLEIIEIRNEINEVLRARRELIEKFYKER